LRAEEGAKMNTPKPLPPEFKDPDLKQLVSYLQSEFADLRGELKLGFEQVNQRLDQVESRLDRIEADARARHVDLRKRFEKLDDRFEHLQSEVGDFKSRVRKVERKVLTEDELFS
jgi:predicted  nucleic acid-binding Zn-ribbon protein